MRSIVCEDAGHDVDAIACGLSELVKHVSIDFGSISDALGATGKKNFQRLCRVLLHARVMWTHPTASAPGVGGSGGEARSGQSQKRRKLGTK